MGNMVVDASKNFTTDRFQDMIIGGVDALRKSVHFQTGQVESSSVDWIEHQLVEPLSDANERVKSIDHRQLFHDEQEKLVRQIE